MPDVFMPRLSDTMEEGSIAQWLKAVGDEVSRGDVLAEIETDKAVMDLEAYDAGVLEQILVEPGQTVPIGERIAVIGDGSGASPADGADRAADDDGPDEPAEDDGADRAADDDGPDEPAEDDGDGAGTGADGTTVMDGDTPPAAGPLKASPVVRSLARKHGIDLAGVRGTGPGGRIIRADVEGLIGAPADRPPAAAAKEPAVPPADRPTAAAEDERIPLSQIRRVTARRLSQAALVPAFQLTTVLDATKLGELRSDINAQLAESGRRVSVTDLLVKAVALILREHPNVNASFDEDAIIRRGRVNVGVAVALDDGLIVPVVKDADTKSLTQISAEVKDLAGRAREGKLKPDEFTGGTFTISNLGMFGIDNFTAVLNPPEAAILAVGSTQDEPVVIDGQVQVRPRSRLTLTVDHRVLDGATGAAFLRDLTDLLTEPLRMLV